MLAALKALASLGHRLDGRSKHDLQAALEQHIFPAEFWDTAKPRVRGLLLSMHIMHMTCPRECWSCDALRLAPTPGNAGPGGEPSTEPCSKASRHSTSDSHAPALPMQVVVTMLWSLARLQLRPPLPWLDAACSTLIAHSEPFSRVRLRLSLPTHPFPAVGMPFN